MPVKASEIPANVISLVGPSGSGKTELISRLLEWFTARGLKVAVLKHSHKTSVAESESARLYRQAGVRAFAQAGPHLVQITRYDEGEPDLPEILAVLSPQTDLVIVEGYKQSPLPKIVLRDPGLENLTLERSRVIALVSREGSGSPVPVFNPDETEKIGLFILSFLGISSKEGGRREEG